MYSMYALYREGTYVERRTELLYGVRRRGYPTECPFLSSVESAPYSVYRSMGARYKLRQLAVLAETSGSLVVRIQLLARQLATYVGMRCTGQTQALRFSNCSRSGRNGRADGPTVGLYPWLTRCLVPNKSTKYTQCNARSDRSITERFNGQQHWIIPTMLKKLSISWARLNFFIYIRLTSMRYIQQRIGGKPEKAPVKSCMCIPPYGAYPEYRISRMVTEYTDCSVSSNISVSAVLR